MESDWVAQLQQRLNQLGFFEGSPTGVFGPRTDASVRALQRRYNLEPDGIVGPSTWSILFP
jgi:peptidoglycan hydrolase-like protein with peptidoglycan-binding domain